MKLKSLLLVFVVLVFGLLAACSDEGSSNNDGKDWTGTITVWDGPRWADPEVEVENPEDANKFFWMEEKIAEFEEAHEGVKIELVQVPWAELPDKLSVSIAGKSWPDVAPVDISGSAVSVEHIEQGVIEPVSEFFTEEELNDFYPNALDAYTFNDELYGVPNSMTVHSMLLNLDLFEEAGVEPPENGEWTWDEFVAAAEKLTFDRDGDGTTDVYGFSTYILPGYYEAWPFFFADGGRPLSEDLSEFTFDEPEAVEAIQKLADLKLEKEVAPVSLGGADVGGTFQAWANEEQRTVAMEPWATWAISAAQNAYPTNFMVANYPTGKAGEPVTIGGVGGWTMFHQEDDGKKEMVAEFIKYISSAEEQFTMSSSYGVFPALQSAAEMEPFADNPEMARAQEMSTQLVMLPRHSDWKKIDEIIQGKLQLVFNGEKTAEEAMKAAQEEVQEYLE